MVRRGVWLAVPIIGALVAGVYALGAVVLVLMGLPGYVGAPLAVRLMGVPLLVAGLALLAWVFRYRGPLAVLDSTFLTLQKLLRRIPVAEPSGRTEPLVVAGPYRWMRHPLYAGVIALTYGIALLVDRTFAWLGAVGLSLWFEFVMAPFEERELIALFGPPYKEYMSRTRRFLPVPRRGRRP